MPETQQASASTPIALTEGTIGSMKEGDVRFAHLSGFWIDKSWQCWLNADQPVAMQKHRNLNLRIERRADGFHVWPGGWQPPNKRPAVTPQEHSLAVVQVHA